MELKLKKQLLEYKLIDDFAKTNEFKKVFKEYSWSKLDDGELLLTLKCNMDNSKGESTLDLVDILYKFINLNFNREHKIRVANIISNEISLGLKEYFFDNFKSWLKSSKYNNSQLKVKFNILIVFNYELPDRFKNKKGDNKDVKN